MEITINAPRCINPLKTGFAKESSRKTNYRQRDDVLESAQKKKITTTRGRGGGIPLAFTLVGPFQQTLHQSDAGSQSSRIRYFNDKDNATIGFTTYSG
jgi:hypothetical protein